jgi:hypothetical protein
MGGVLRVYGFMGSRVEDLVCLVGLEVIERLALSGVEVSREHQGIKRFKIQDSEFKIVWIISFIGFL